MPRPEPGLGWTVETLLYHVDMMIELLQQQLRERFDGQQLSVREALAAQEKALETALTASEKHKDQRFADIWTEFHEHLVQVREETRVAFIASEKAIDKAESSMNKRLDAMNEFRDQLREQAATFMRREESLQRHDATNDKVDAIEKRLEERIESWKLDANKADDALNDKIVAINRRIDLQDGARAGTSANVRNIYAFVAFVGVVISIIVLISNHVI